MTEPSGYPLTENSWTGVTLAATIQHEFPERLTVNKHSPEFLMPSERQALNWNPLGSIPEICERQVLAVSGHSNDYKNAAITGSKWS